MSDPFKSDYVVSTQPITTSQTVTTTPQLEAPAVAKSLSTSVTALTGGAQVFGFEPRLYGTGKPRRIVIRGKIAIG